MNADGRVDVHLMRLPEADPDIPLPRYETEGAAGADVRANLPPSDRVSGLTLAPGGRALIPTGFSCAIPGGYEMQVRARSGLALRHGLALANGVGTIDADYRGALGIIVVNLGEAPVTVSHGMRIAQLVVAPVTRATFTVVDTLEATDRGDGGFGSTGTG